ncbi:IclR family transcriptional regulator [Propioniciclava soli]|uniref:IclR family transcriptional regulator n=1 Tax=Propioniciclava soli TaxID=2775081 RepID=UPI001E5C1DFE|nr:IclR family transcriptional regulator [Propioniciclava soli]
MAPARSGRDDVPAGAAPAVVRATAVLDALAASPRGFLALSELAREVGVAKSSTLQICTALEAGGLIRRDEAGYWLGRRTVELGGAYLSRLDQVTEFYDACARSSLMAGETLRLSVLAGIDTLCLARYEGHPPVRYTSGIGDRTPASATAQGKALLAKLDDAEVRRLYHGIPDLPQLTARSRATLPELLADLADARARGFAVDEEESAPHVVGLAVAVPTRGLHAPVLALSVTLLDAEASAQRRDAMVTELGHLSRRLGNPMQPSTVTGS